MIRDVCPRDVFGRYGMPVGDIIDVPRLPAKMLLDDINHYIVELMVDNPNTDSEYFRYKMYSYPESRYEYKEA